MATWQREKKIRFLVERRFGDIERFKEAVEYLIARRRGEQPTGPGLFGLAGKALTFNIFDRDTVAMIVELIDTLEGLDDDELDRVFGVRAYKPPGEEATETLVERFNAEWFGGPDFAHWARTAFWTWEEALHLSLGVEPGYLADHSIGYLYESNIAHRYIRRRDLFMRSLVQEELQHQMPPHEFVDWAERRDVEMPAELVEQVRLIAERLSSDHTGAPQPLSPTLAVAPADTDEGRIEARERDTFQAIVIAMAAEQYGYNPRAKCSQVPSRIREDITSVELDVSEQTIRTKLKSAATLLSAEVLQRLADSDN